MLIKRLFYSLLKTEFDISAQKLIVEKIAHLYSTKTDLPSIVYFVKQDFCYFSYKDAGDILCQNENTFAMNIDHRRYYLLIFHRRFFVMNCSTINNLEDFFTKQTLFTKTGL